MYRNMSDLLKCNSCNDGKMFDLPDVYALIKVTKESGGVVFHGDEGLVVVAKVCEKCGKLEFNSAIAARRI